MNKYLVIRLGFIAIVGVATLLIGFIVLRSPDTHANLGTGVRGGYGRTEIASLGGQAGAGERHTDVALSLRDPRAVWQGEGQMEPGRRGFIDAGCATCHGVDARGGPVGPSLAGAAPDVVERMVREGRGGMPAYSPARLSEDALGQIRGYLARLELVRPDAEDVARIQRLTYDPLTPKDLVLAGRVSLRRSCGACHAQPTKDDILKAFNTDAEATALVAEMVQDTNLSWEDGRTIAYYILALRNGADPIRGE